MADSTPPPAPPGSRSYAERHASAGRTFERFVPEVDPERVHASFVRRLGALGAFAYDVVGAMWDRPQLSRRDRSLLVISLLAAQARGEELVAHTQNGLRHGLTRVEIEEILLHVAAYAGYPAAMAASRSIDDGLRAYESVERLPPRSAPAEKSDVERDRDGTEVLHTMTGGATPSEPAEALAQITAALGGVGEVALRWAFGEIWCRPELSRRDRSIVTVTILTALGAESELRFHTRAALRHGVTPAELEEVVTHLSLYAGIPRAVGAMRVVREVLANG